MRWLSVGFTEKKEKEMTKLNTLEEAKKFAFDAVCAGFEAQGWERSVTSISNGSSGNVEVFCAYRGDEGRKCAAGHLIRDGRYLPSMEGRNISALLGYDKPISASGFGDILLEPLSDFIRENPSQLGDFRRFVRSMQSLHDGENEHFTLKERFNAMRRDPSYFPQQ